EDTEAIHQLRSGGQGLKGCLRARDPRLKPLSDQIRLLAAEHDLTPVQACQRPRDPFCTLPDLREVALIAEIVPEVHPRVELVEDEARLTGGPGHRPGYPHTLGYLRIVQPGSGLEVGLRRHRLHVKPPGEDPRLRR